MTHPSAIYATNAMSQDVCQQLPLFRCPASENSLECPQWVDPSLHSRPRRRQNCVAAVNWKIALFAEQADRRDRNNGSWAAPESKRHVQPARRVAHGFLVERPKAFRELFRLREGLTKFVGVHLIYPSAVSTGEAAAAPKYPPVWESQARRDANNESSPIRFQRDPVQVSRQPRIHAIANSVLEPSDLFIAVLRLDAHQLVSDPFVLRNSVDDVSALGIRHGNDIVEELFHFLIGAPGQIPLKLKISALCGLIDDKRLQVAGNNGFQGFVDHRRDITSLPPNLPLTRRVVSMDEGEERPNGTEISQ